jgi:hypothetical protein
MTEAHEELQELQERAEHAAQHAMAPVSLTMAVLAVLVAVVTLLGHRAHTEEGLLQTKVTDQWAYYQARNGRVISYELFLEQLSILPAKDQERAAKAREKYTAAVEHERERQKEIQAEARQMEHEIDIERRRADRFDLGEGLLEAALVITSITLLTRRRQFWYLGSAVALIGLILSATALRIHP